MPDPPAEPSLRPRAVERIQIVGYRVAGVLIFALLVLCVVAIPVAIIVLVLIALTA